MAGRATRGVSVTFFFDNNLSKDLAAGMKAFGEPVLHMNDLHPEGDPGDEVWLPEIGTLGYCLVTRDAAIRRRPGELRAYRLHEVGSHRTMRAMASPATAAPTTWSMIWAAK